MSTEDRGEAPRRRLGGLSARIVTIEELFQSGRFRPAAVQRDYQWTDENCTTLLADLCHALEVEAGAAEVPLADGPGDAGARALGRDDDPIDPELIPGGGGEAASPASVYFLGTLVLTPSADADGTHWIDIYDGLQRLTTVTMLLALLRDLAVADALGRHLAGLVAAAPDRPRLVLRTGARILREEVLAAGATLVPRRQRRGLSPAEHRLRSAMTSLRTTLASWAPARAEAFARSLVERAVFAVTEVADARMARQIFVSTNLHSVRLNRVDLFKGQLLDLAPDAGTADAIQERWTRIARTLVVPEPVTRAPRDDLDRFLVAVDFIERRRHQGADCLAVLAAHLAERPGPGGIAGWVERLEKLALAWRELHERIAELHRRPVDREIWKLRFFWWEEWRPLALLWYRDYMAKRGRDGRAPKKTWQAFERRFAALHGRCLAIILADYSPNDRTTIFANAISQTRQGIDPLKRALAFDQRAIDKIRRSLTVPLTELHKRVAAVQWIEASMWGDDLPEHLAAMQVEHVLPQNTEEGSVWRDVFPDEEDRYDAAHSLGNLACIDARRNREIGNSDFATKVAAYRREPEFKTLQQVAASGFWNGDMIRAREHVLVDLVFERLALPVLPTGFHGRGGS